MFGEKLVKQPSIMKHDFSNVPEINTQRSTFKRDFRHLTTFDAGYLIPIFHKSVIPGDTISLGMNFFARLATPLFPTMDNLYLDSHFFYVPERLTQTNFLKLMGEQDNPGDSIDFSTAITSSPASVGHAEGSLYDYLGIPTQIPDLDHRNVTARCYNLIWNDHFRDQNLQNKVTVDLDDGPDDPTDYVLLKRGKRHDYFTSCLPWAQKGDAVTISLGDTLNIQALSGDTSNATGDMGYDSTIGLKINNIVGGPFTSGEDITLEADLSTLASATINDQRLAFQTQVFLERDARSGTRYPEFVYAHFGVTVPDYRPNRPEYLGGSSSRMNVHPVPQTSNDGTNGSVGQLASYATVSGDGDGGHGFTQSFTEHGWVIGLVSVRADLTYQQGLDRDLSRRTRLDFYFPEFAHLGEQAVLKKEIMAQGSLDTTDEDTFGFQEATGDMGYDSTIGLKINNIVGGPFTSGEDITLEADLSTLASATINDQRLAFQTQVFLERDARSGTRYPEFVYAHFGVTVPDYRPNRPEYLGGSSSRMNVHPVPQTSNDGTNGSVGQLASYATVSGDGDGGHGFTQSFTEHGWVIGLVSVRADLTYQQGLDRDLSRRTRLDFYFPEFAHLGEQAVLKKEIMAQGSLDTTDEDTFGFQEAWAEMRYSNSIISGAFRSNAATSLDAWHTSQEFSAVPALNSTFIQEDPPIDRIIKTPSEPHVIMDAYFDFNHTRPMPTPSDRDWEFL